ncbi:uncharacterized protein MELLADRAFT_104045 [Melampsora larici-populina 98AG31]|uniref:Uncharacterized protein n=1 Tax=Melampsora larici-populina (strain 98AG31 / pathotype 3-4-7) TaxID=747676 RepID=F4RDD4_MELLP|nr:uncharacterized protein MELLADRAFT_104045 [Melampsora larici-populina 98AG31]EGG09629.1 hypothetical protein MELLADRAFT_104045 [Melampsora larici-populina 98AG31]
MSQSPLPGQSDVANDPDSQQNTVDSTHNPLPIAEMDDTVIPNSYATPTHAILAPVMFDPHPGHDRDHEAADALAKDETDQFRRRNISYAAVRRFVGTPLREYLIFTGLSTMERARVLRILSGQSITSFLIFLFPDLITPQQMYAWGIPYGVAAELILHAEGFYQKLLQKERRYRARSLEL